MHSLRFLSQAAALPLLCALAGCASNQPLTYSGPLTPQAGTCDPPQRASLIRRGKYIEFTPTQGVLILNGQIGADGQVTAALSQPGADRRPYNLNLAGTLSGQVFSGTYITPRCRYAVNLTQGP